MIPFNDAQVRSLEALVDAWGTDRVVLVGASALQCHMEMSWRATSDVDITVSADLDEFEGLLSGIADWHFDPRVEHRLRSPWNVKVDVVPAGPGLRAAGKLVWPRSGHEMQLVGMDLVFEHAVTEPLGHTALRIASLPTIVILKMNSWLDRFEDRERDLADIGHVLEDAVRPDDDRRFDDHIVELAMDYELVCAYLIGEDVGRIAKDHHRRRVDEFLAKVGDEDNWAHTRMRAVGPWAWRHSRCTRAWPERQEPIATANSRALATTPSRSKTHEKSPAVCSPTGLSSWPRRTNGSVCGAACERSR